jgi:hypothetical protein
VIKSSGVLQLQGVDRRTIWDHFKNYVPYHLPNLDPTIIMLTWIPPLDIHVRYVKGQTMLIRCFAIIVMVDTIYFASSWSSLKFLSTFGTIHHVRLQHLDFYSDHATLFLG